MTPISTPRLTTTRTRSNAHDYDELATIYAHLDSTTTIGASVFPGAAAENVPWWANRNESVYVEQLPNGLTQITYILWAVQL